MNSAFQIAPDILLALQNIVGENRIKTDHDSLEKWGKDHSKHFAPHPSVIVFPETTEQVQAIVKLANQLNFAITPSGGRTGLSAGAVAHQGEVVLSLDKMNQILQFYPADRMVRIQAGVITEQLQDYAAEQDLYYPVDFASAGSSQLGGNIATNAGGIKVIKYGMTRSWILGLTVVTGNGDILHLNKGMIKNATGYALQHLFIGGEGTLGIVTEAEIRLERPPQDLQVMVFGVPDFESVMPIMHAFRKHLDLTAFEFFNDLSMRKVLEHGLVNRPFESPCPFYVLLEFEAPFQPLIDQAMEIFESCMEQGWIVDGVMSQSLEQAQNLWRLREDISESISPYTPYKNDISVLISHVPSFIEEVENIVAEKYPEFEVCWFGHIGDGNLHLNILKPPHMETEDFFSKCEEVNSYVFEVVNKFEGSISAEHGVGMTKKNYLEFSRTEIELSYMKALKKVFDQNWIMNPGKLIDP